MLRRGNQVALLALIAVGAMGAGKPKVAQWFVTAPPATMHPLFVTTPTERAVDELLQVRIFEPASQGWRSRVVADPVVLDRVVSLAVIPGTVWSDGQPVVGADLCATVDRMLDRSHPTRWTAGTVARVESCRDDPAHPEVAAITLTHAGVDPRAALALPLLPAHRPDWTGFKGGKLPEGTIPVGAGTHQARVRGGILEIVSPTGGLPLRFVATEDPVAAFLADGPGRVEVGPADLARVRGVTGVTVDRVLPGSTWALFLDTTRPPFDDPATRAAVDAALDREGLAAAWLGRDPSLDKQPWTLVSGPFPAGSRLASHGVPVPTHDATALGERKLELELAVPAGAAAFGEALQAALPGSTVTTHELTVEQWAFSLLDGGHAGTSHAALVRLDDEPCAYLHSRTETDGWANPFGFSDPGLDLACDALRRGESDAGPILHGRAADAHPALFLWTVEGRVAYRP
ncbi:MAG: hypothetical protein H6738_11250 [Alphaproteobacteria bacterium]|nr:hypothetical protein [Alphaproteobacteria bacterium]MCB9697346.1 hypothetical protein [Alphaproteobacteria bacterium]